MTPRARRDSERLKRVLLALCAFFFTVAAALSIYVVRERAGISSLKAELLSEAELQRELLRSQESDHAVFPHVRNDLGFVLNPHMGRSTWKGPDGGSYPINSLGLRGEEIPPKPEGVTRVLLVGDSVLFGWRLEEEDTVASILQGIVSERLPQARVECLTIAVPGWNVRNERSFLDGHLGLLDPDFVVWSLIRNDIDDSAGLVPPGVLGRWASPQKPGEVPFVVNFDFQRDVPMPLVRARWMDNLDMIRDFADRTGVGTLVLWWRARKRPLLDLLMQQRDTPLETVVVPEEFRYDERRWCLSPTDCHPTPWASRIVALGLLGRLIELGVIPNVRLEPEESAIAEAFERERGRSSSPESILEFVDTRLAVLPTEYDDAEPDSSNAVLYGIVDGKIQRNGALYLRDELDATALRVVLRPSAGAARADREALFRLRNRSGDEESTVVRLDPDGTEFVIRLPKRAGDDVYELSWEIGFSDCERPDFCYSGVLVRAAFVG